MEQSAKKLAMIAVIVVCLILAGVVTFMTMERTGVPNYLAKEMTWVICRNQACENSYQITKKDYFVHVQKHHDWQMPEAPPLICPKCAEDSVYRAVKCEKCELVFEMGSVPKDYNDRCPKCRYSKIESRQEQKRAAAAGE